MQGIQALATTASSTPNSFNPTTLIFIVLIVAVFYLLMIRPQQRRKQQAQQQANTLGPGAEVVTTAGMYATVTAVDGDDVILEVAPGCEVRYMKRAIMNVVRSADAVAEESAADEAPVDEADTADESPVEDTVEAPVGEQTEVEDDAESAYERATGTKKD